MPENSATQISLVCPPVIRMAQMSLHDELLNQQQETINSFIKLLEEEISQNSQWVQNLIEQGSSTLPKSILGQVGDLIEREKQNASKLQVLEELNREAMEIAEEQHGRLEELRLNLTTPLTSDAEASEPENYSGAGLKTTSRANLISAVPSVLPQEAVVCNYESHPWLRQEQPLEKHAALLRDEVFSVIPGTVNM